MTYEEFVALPDDALLKPREVASALRVDAKTVTRWSKAGKIKAVHTLGGHRRFRKIEVVLVLKQAEREWMTGDE
jgi:excisionase family DNA binding protein